MNLNCFSFGDPFGINRFVFDNEAPKVPEGWVADEKAGEIRPETPEEMEARTKAAGREGAKKVESAQTTLETRFDPYWKAKQGKPETQESLTAYAQKYTPETLKGKEINEYGWGLKTKLIKMGEKFRNAGDVKFYPRFDTAIAALGDAKDLRDQYYAARDLYNVAREAGVSAVEANKIFTYGLEGNIGMTGDFRELALARVSNVDLTKEAKISATATAEIQKAGSYEEIVDALSRWDAKRTEFYKKQPKDKTDQAVAATGAGGSTENASSATETLPEGWISDATTGQTRLLAPEEAEAAVAGADCPFSVKPFGD